MRAIYHFFYGENLYDFVFSFPDLPNIILHIFVPSSTSLFIHLLLNYLYLLSFITTFGLWCLREQRCKILVRWSRLMQPSFYERSAGNLILKVFPYLFRVHTCRSPLYFPAIGVQK